MVTRPRSAVGAAPDPQTAAGPTPQPAGAEGASGSCRPAHDEAACPACGAEMRLWANYYRCRTCGFKESCCF